MTGYYGRLLEAWMRELEAEVLQQLPEGFYREMSEYVSRLREQTRMLEHGTMRSRIALKEREYAERMLRELFNTRLRKIVSMEVEGVQVEASALQPEEKLFHSELRRILSEHVERLKSILLGRPPRIEAKQTAKGDYKVVRFLQAIPAIMGVDMKTYGPFKPEDVASIPLENAESLIRRGVAKEVEVSE
ncbi:DNA replication complex GINS family protein [Candidatus Bathyarchaeota archaeon]|nr:DNA replication complex GINS family protein [Candidatus Bathyarchaeota archaeon]